MHSVKGPEKRLIFSKHKIIFITLFSSRYTRENVTGKRSGKTANELEKNHGSYEKETSKQRLKKQTDK